MNIRRRFDSNGDSFENMFQELINTKVDDFVNKKYQKNNPERSVLPNV